MTTNMEVSLTRLVAAHRTWFSGTRRLELNRITSECKKREFRDYAH